MSEPLVCAFKLTEEELCGMPMYAHAHRCVSGAPHEPSRYCHPFVRPEAASYWCAHCKQQVHAQHVCGEAAASDPEPRDCVCPTVMDGPNYSLQIIPECPWHSRPGQSSNTDSSPAEPMALEVERRNFEKWANAKGTVGNSWNGEYYENFLHETAWQSWQARAALEHVRSIS